MLHNIFGGVKKIEIDNTDYERVPPFLAQSVDNSRAF